MRTFETAAVISLVDHLSGPLQQLANKTAATNATLAAAGKRMMDAGRAMTFAVTLPVAVGLAHLAEASKKFSEQENTFKGVIENRARIMGLGAQATEEYLRQQQRVAKEAETLGYTQSGGRLDSLEYRQALVQGVKANMDAEQAAAAATASFDLALAGRIGQHDANEHLINVSQAFGLITKNVDGTNRSFQQMLPQFQRYSDILAVMSSNSNMTVDQAADALKLSAPLAHIGHISPALIAAMHESQAELGIKGSEAGVNVRSFLLSLMAPKSTAVPALAQHGVDLNKFLGFEGVTPESYTKFMSAKGINITSDQAKKLFSGAANEEGSTDYSKLTADSAAYLRRAGKKASPLTPDLAAKYSQQFLNSHMENTNILGALMGLRDAHLAPGALAAMMEKRQIPRSWAYLMKPSDEERANGKQDVFANSMRRAFGEDWENTMRTAAKMSRPEDRDEYLQKMEKFGGSATKMRSEHAAGMEGAFLRISAAFTHLKAALHDSGAFKIIEDGLNSVANALDKAAGMDPSNLQMMVKFLATIATVGPALAVFGALTAAIGALGALPALGIAAAIAGLMHIPGALDRIKAAAHTFQTEFVPPIMNGLRTAVRVADAIGSFLGPIFNKWLTDAEAMGKKLGAIFEAITPYIEKVIGMLRKALAMIGIKFDDDPKAAGTHVEHKYAPDDPRTNTNTLDRMRQMTTGNAGDEMGKLDRALAEFGKGQDVRVEGQVKGQVDIMNKVVVEPSPLLQSIVNEAKQATANVNGAINKLGHTATPDNGVAPSK